MSRSNLEARMLDAEPIGLQVMGWVKPDRSTLKSSQRRRIHARDEMMCRYCGCECTHDVPGIPRAGNAATVDHRTPRCRGGASTDDNLCCACWDCNRAKGAMTEIEFRTTLFDAAYADSVRAEEACRQIIQDIKDSSK